MFYKGIDREAAVLLSATSKELKRKDWKKEYLLLTEERRREMEGGGREARERKKEATERREAREAKWNDQQVAAQDKVLTSIFLIFISSSYYCLINDMFRLFLR